MEERKVEKKNGNKLMNWVNNQKNEELMVFENLNDENLFLMNE
jgi:hypothetical protein